MNDDISGARPGTQADGNGTPDAGDSQASQREASAPQSHEALQLSLQDAQAKADEYWNELLRARAELSNLQRRADREVSNAHKYGLERFAGELLPVLDSLELGLNAASEGGNPDPEKLREGMALTLKLLVSAAEKFGIRPVDPRGEKFNPEQHQAMATQPTPAVEPNTVVTVYQKGWMLNDRLLRPAMVVVAAAPGAEPADAPSGAGQGGGKLDEMA
jgi:molecular chaperone GrpE